MTEFGWLAIAADGDTLLRLVFGYPSRAAALSALDVGEAEPSEPRGALAALVEKLQDFCAGTNVDFRRVKLDLSHLTSFQRRVIQRCRNIAHGRSRSYGELAAEAGSPGAARAVGNTMAANRFPLIVPCHRVINSDGSLGNYGGPEGVRMKLRLLSLEGHPLGAEDKRRASTRPIRQPLTSAKRSAAFKVIRGR